MGGAIIKLFFLMIVLALVVEYAYLSRALFGVIGERTLSAIGVNESEAFTPEQKDFLNILDTMLLALPVFGFILIALLISIAIFRRSTEGQKYQW